MRALFAALFAAATAIALAFLLLPVAAIFLRVPPGDLLGALGHNVTRDALVVSIKTSAIAHAAVLVVGTPAAYVLSRRRFPGRGAVLTLIELPLVLPTEAQWEYACRAGTQIARYEARIDAIAWYRANSNNETHEVGQKRPNAWGLYDMLGNVWEWCHDGLRTYDRGEVVDPVGPLEAGADRVIRGGSWLDAAQYVRAANRDGDRPGDLGFRCASPGVSA